MACECQTPRCGDDVIIWAPGSCTCGRRQRDMVAGLFLEGYAAGVQGKPFSSLDDDPYNARRFGHLRGSKLHSEAAKEAELFGYDASFGRL